MVIFPICSITRGIMVDVFFSWESGDWRQGKKSSASCGKCAVDIVHVGYGHPAN